MTGGYLLVIVLAVVAVAYIVAPLLRKDALEAERSADNRSEERDLLSKHGMLLASLKDLEEDHATAKIDDEDYEELRSRLTGEAVEILKQLDKQKQKQKEEDEAQKRPHLVPPDTSA